MNTERLIILRDHLKKIATQPRRRIFSLSTWFTRGNLEDAGVPNACGTSACAMGEACFIPEFKAAGLRLNGEPRGRPTKSDSISLWPVFTDADGREHTGTDAAVALLGLSYRQAKYLFMPMSYPKRNRTSPMAVARRIDKVLRGTAPPYIL